MRVAMTTVAAGRLGRVNEDFVAALPSAAVLIDGAGIPGSESVCRHGVAWYVTGLGSTLLGLLSGGGHRDLAGLLAEAITQMADLHRGTCAIGDPISPSAAVAILRVRGGHVEHLVLGDCVVVLDPIDRGPVVIDDRREVLIGRSYEERLRAVEQGGDEYHQLLRAFRAHRNRAGGFWVAKDDPQAAYEAVTGSCPVSGLTSAVLLSNGASRIVDLFGLTDWPGMLAILASSGPAGIIHRVREAEARDAIAADDATIAHCTDLDPEASSAARSPT